VKLIGWGTQNGYSYWLLMNSFGPLWGEQGLFKIGMDGIDNTDFGYSIIGPRFKLNMANTTFSSVILVFMMQIFQNVY